MLFPESSAYSKDDKIMQQSITSFYNDNTRANQRLWREGLVDSMFEAGDQGLWNGFYLQYPNMDKPIFNFNLLRRIKNTAGGRQRQQRKMGVVIPSDSNATSQTADQLTKILAWHNRTEEVLETYSIAFDQALTVGLSLLHVWMDYRNDSINGEMKVDAVTYDSFVMDSFFRKQDLSDCRGIWRRTYVTPMELKLLMPRSNVDLTGLDASSARDGKFNYMAEALYATTTNKLLAYDEFYYLTTRSATMVIDPFTAMETEWYGTKEALNEYIAYFPHLRVQVKEKPTVRLAILANGRLIYDDRNPLGTDSYPFVGMFGYFNPSISDFAWRIQGMIRGLRDTSFLFNRIHVLLLDMVESKVNTGWIYVDGKLVNPKDTYKTGQGQNIILKPGAEIGRDIQPIVAQEIPSSYFSVLESLGKLPEIISGVNETMMGMDTGDKTISGLLTMMRQDAGATQLQPLFDQFDRSQKACDKLRIEAIQHNFTPSKVKQIIGEEPTAWFYKEELGKYDIALELANLTTTQRQQNFAQLLHLQEVGMQIPSDQIIKASTLQNKKELLEAIAKKEQAAAQQQEMQMQAQIAQLNAQTELAKSRAIADQGLGMERVSRIEENKALAEERKAAAIKDEETALLNVVKALKELDGIDLNQIQQAAQILNMIKMQESQVTETQNNESQLKEQLLKNKDTVSKQPMKVKNKIVVK